MPPDANHEFKLNDKSSLQLCVPSFAQIESLTFKCATHGSHLGEAFMLDAFEPFPHARTATLSAGFGWQALLALVSCQRTLILLVLRWDLRLWVWTLARWSVGTAHTLAVLLDLVDEIIEALGLV